ncbi:hypothetical protein BX600DRAFT_151986 [Xylariales sp. PMI_506]|nr:hypothetical protein BX600DRAFT_151986 [Xylariales sp. PMI_506]
MRSDKNHHGLAIIYYLTSVIRCLFVVVLSKPLPSHLRYPCCSSKTKRTPLPSVTCIDRSITIPAAPSKLATSQLIWEIRHTRYLSPLDAAKGKTMRNRHVGERSCKRNWNSGGQEVTDGAQPSPLYPCVAHILFLFLLLEYSGAVWICTYFCPKQMITVPQSSGRDGLTLRTFDRRETFSHWAFKTNPVCCSRAQSMISRETTRMRP